MRRIALDSNILILLAVGSVRPSLVTQHKRLSAYKEHDFYLLRDIVKVAEEVVVTPFVLSEASNLLGYRVLKDSLPAFQVAFRHLISRTTECVVQSVVAANTREFMWLDLADCAWLETLSQGQILLTDDSKLRDAVRARGLKAASLQEIAKALSSTSR